MKVAGRGAAYLLVASLCIATLGGPVSAGEDIPVPAEVQSDANLTPELITKRTAFLIESLESRHKYATRWHRAWLGIYSLGVIIEGARAGITDHDGARAEYLVSATKSAIGLTELYLRPVRDRFGAQPIRKMPDETDEERLRRLQAAENLLRVNAKRDRSRYGWLPHVANLALNVVGGGVLLAIDEPERAAISTGVGIVFGELFIWTQPRGADEDWHAYRVHFGEKSEPQLSFGVMPGGLAVQYRF